MRLSPVRRQIAAADPPLAVSRPIRHVVRIRARAVLIGLMCVPALCWWSMRTEIINGGAELIEASLLMIAVFLLFCLTLLNNAIRCRWPRLALTQAELLTIYVMQTTSVGLAGLGQIQFLNQALGGAYYYAKPENHWAKFQSFIPAWWTPDRRVLDAYYKGNSTLFTLEHLLGWAIPIVAWTGFILLMLFAFLCLNTLLRRQWMERERLSFPLTALPLELTRENATQSLLSSREFWAAFLLVCVFRSVTGLHRIAPNIPDIGNFGYKGQLIDLEPMFASRPWNAIGYFRLSFHPIIIGITYFLPLDVGFSAWFFYLVVKAEIILATALGYRDTDASAASAAIPYIGEQGAGAFLAVALFAFWGARRHLRCVLRKAFGSAPEVDDTDEPLSYRTAVLGLMASFGGLVAYVVCGGLPWLPATLFFLLYLLLITASTRFRAEAGPMLGYGPDMNPHQMLVQLPGSQSWDARSLTPLAYLYWFDSDYRTVAMPQQMEAIKIADVAGIPARRLSIWMLAASLLACVAAFISVLAIYYHYGAITPRGDNGWRSTNGHAPFDLLMNWIDNPTRPDTARLEGIGIGFVFAGLLIAGRQRFFWWPFHPVGFALAHAGWSLPWVWFATFLGWLAKASILRYGGMKLYRRCIPWFMGLLLGDIVISCAWSALGVLLDTQMYMFFPG
jgi:hypothetical protein